LRFITILPVDRGTESFSHYIFVTSGTEQMDGIDFLIKVAMGGCFIAYAICIWLIKRERDKRKRTGEQNPPPPKITKD